MGSPVRIRLPPPVFSGTYRNVGAFFVFKMPLTLLFLVFYCIYDIFTISNRRESINYNIIMKKDYEAPSMREYQVQINRCICGSTQVDTEHMTIINPFDGIQEEIW